MILLKITALHFIYHDEDNDDIGDYVRILKDNLLVLEDGDDLPFLVEQTSFLIFFALPC